MHKHLYTLAVITMMVFAVRGTIAQCCGDCNGDGRVTVDELVTVATRALSTCRNDGICAGITADLAACNTNLTSTQNSLTTCNTNYSTCRQDLGQCNTNLGTCENNLTTCNINYSTCTTNLATCNSNYSTCSASLAACNSNLTNTQNSLTTCNGNLTTCNASLTACGAGTATTANVLSGKTFSSSAGLGLTGTMPNNGAVMITPGTTPQTIPAGYHNGAGKVLGDSHLVPGNIKSGVSIFGVVGTLACGNGVIDAGEECDQGNLNGQTCITEGFAGGALACGANCIFDTSGCYMAGARFVDNGDGTITDNNTGLVWEKKAWDGGIHDKHNTYTWANAFGAFIASLNAAAFAGHTNWRLPTVKELQSIIDYQNVNPVVSSEFNTHCVPGCNVTTCSCTQPAPYWSSTPYAGTPGEAWEAEFVAGIVEIEYEGGSLNVRAVRGGGAPSPPPPTCGDGVVEPPEDCDIGGTCIGTAKAGTHCTTDNAAADCCSNAGCTGANDGGVCLAGDKAAAACTQDSDCPGSACVRCKVFEGKTPSNAYCAANCTFESSLVFNLLPGQLDPANPLAILAGTSGAEVHGEVLSLPLPIGNGCVGGANNNQPCTSDGDCPEGGKCEPATQTFGLGKDRGDGVIPLVVKSASVRFPQINVGGLACACVRGVSQKSCGGTVFEADGTTETPFCTANFGICDTTKHCAQLTSVSCTTNADCEGATFCTAAHRNPCAFVHGDGNSASGSANCSAAGIHGINYLYTRDAGGCSNPPTCDQRTPKAPAITFSGTGPAGSAILLNTTAIGTAVGACSGTDVTVYGPDGQICTDDDPQASRGTPQTIPLTTGQAASEVFHANFSQAGATDVNICNIDPVTGACVPYSTQGTPFSCSALGSGQFPGGGLVSAFVSLGQPTIGDVVVVSQFYSLH